MDLKAGDNTSEEKQQWVITQVKKRYMVITQMKKNKSG